MEDIDTKDFGAFALVAPTTAQHLLTEDGRISIADLYSLFIATFNSGANFVGKTKISPTTKALYVYCVDELYHKTIPATVDGAQMPAIDEEGVSDVQ